jgi:hypothetical protein
MGQRHYCDLSGIIKIEAAILSGDRMIITDENIG